MNAHPGDWKAVEAARSIEGVLRFARSGERSYLIEQRSPYPFHITRPFRLDTSLPHVATLYLQSAAGGLYRGDRLNLAMSAAGGAYAHITTQAATLVHDTKGQPVHQTARIDVADGAFLAFTPDPTVLFSNAALVSQTDVFLAPGAQAILGEAYAWHDPEQAGRPFASLSAAVNIRASDGRLLAADRGGLSGPEWAAAASPMGGYRAVGAMFMLGEAAGGFDATTLEQRLAGLGCLAGVSTLPNRAGSVVRLLAADGGALSRGLDAAFETAFEALLGIAPARRRK